MKENPLISIITVNLNDLEGLKKTVRSVLEQTFYNWEFIIIDGGSTDGSKEFIENIQKGINYWISEPDTGIYNGMNKGIKVATGKYLLFLNSGDHLYNSTVLAECSNYLLTSDIVYSDLNVINSDGSNLRRYPASLSFRYFIKGTLPHPASFIKAVLFQKYGFYDEEYKIVSDWKFFVEVICKHNVSYYKTNCTLSTHYLGGVSSNPLNRSFIREERQKVLKKDYRAFYEDYMNFQSLQDSVAKFKKSRRSRLLVWLNLINKI